MNWKYAKLSCFGKGRSVVTARDRSQKLLFVFLVLHSCHVDVLLLLGCAGRHTFRRKPRRARTLLPAAACNSRPPASPPAQEQQSWKEALQKKVLTLSAKCLMIKALLDKRGFSKRAHLFKWVLYSFWAQVSSEPFGIYGRECTVI